MAIIVPLESIKDDAFCAGHRLDAKRAGRFHRLDYCLGRHWSATIIDDEIDHGPLSHFAWESGFHRMYASPKAAAAIVGVALKTISRVCQ